MKRIYVVGTADTKGEELAFLAEKIRALGADPLVVDVGIRAPTIPRRSGQRTSRSSDHPDCSKATIAVLPWPAWRRPSRNLS